MYLVCVQNVRGTTKKFFWNKDLSATGGSRKVFDE